MATLYGQNLRILLGTYVVAKATSCQISMTNEAESSSSKDDVGLVDKQDVVKKSWSVQVDSLDVSDVGSIMSGIKNKEKFMVIWDETSTTNNQSTLGADFSQMGFAYITDATFVFNNRTISTKSLTLTGSSALTSNSQAMTLASAGTITRGQYVRLYLSSNSTDTPIKVIGAAENLQLHVSCTVEDVSTKDTVGDYVINEVTAISYDITTEALVRSGETITSLVAAQDLTSITNIYKAGLPVKWQIANVSGDNNRTKGTVLASGLVQITQLQISAQNRQRSTYNATMQGYGEYNVGS